MAFCNNCGKPLADGKPFCGGCGAKTGETPKQTEKIGQQARLVLATSKKEGFLKRTPCYMVFYENELILAHFGRQRQKSELDNYRRQLKDEGKGFLKSTFALMGFMRDYGNRYYIMHRQLVLEEESENTAIGYSDILKFLFKSRDARDIGTNNSTQTARAGVVKIKTLSSKYSFTHEYSDSNKNIRNILSPLLGKKLKYRGGTFTITIGGNRDGIY